MQHHYIEITSAGRCYRLDLRAKELYREREERVPLRPKEWDVLRFLIDQCVASPRQLVTRDKLQEHVWGGDERGNGAIDRTVNAVRAALGDTRKNASFIETVYRDGYRFIADVTQLHGRPEAGTRQASSLTLNENSHFSPLKLRALALALASNNDDDPSAALDALVSDRSLAAAEILFENSIHETSGWGIHGLVKLGAAAASWLSRLLVHEDDAKVFQTYCELWPEGYRLTEYKDRPLDQYYELADIFEEIAMVCDIKSIQARFMEIRPLYHNYSAMNPDINILGTIISTIAERHQ